MTAVRGLDRALRTGMLGGLVQGLGLPQSAGTGVEAFLKAIGEQAGSSDATANEGGAMETD
jgi:26S proteasome regulatory subunit N13